MSASSCCRSAKEGPCDWLLSAALQFKLRHNVRGEGDMRASARRRRDVRAGTGSAPDFNGDGQQMLLLVPTVLCAPRLQLQLSLGLHVANRNA